MVRRSLLLGLILAFPVHAADHESAPGAEAAVEAEAEASVEASAEAGYEREEVMEAAVRLFGEASEGLAKAIEKAFAEQGRPNAYIAGEETAGALVVGVRYGSGTLMTKTSEARDVYWKGPSIGFDWGGNVSKTFILVYGLDDQERLFQRFPGVDGSLYLIGGIGLNYNQSESTILAPIRAGVGLRAGASVGYVHFTKERSWVPF